MQDALDEALRGGDVERAIAVSRQWAEALLQEGRQADQVGLEIARAAAATYRDLVTEPVHQFQARAAQALPQGVGSVVERALKRLMDLSLAWEQRLEVVYRERLARELRDFTRGRAFPQALENIRLLCGAARSDDDSHRLAQYCGNILGTCENHPREVEAVMDMLAKDPGAHGLTLELVNELRAARQKRLDILMKSRMETREIEWNRMVTETVVEIQRQLPPKDRLDEPDEAVLRDTADLMRSLVRVPLWRGQPNKFIDATLLLVEFVPKELATAAAQSGVEGRVYNTLGYTAKKAVLLGFGQVGKSRLFTDAYDAFAREVALGTPYVKAFVEVMGATRSPAFYGFLTEGFGKKALVGVQEEIIDGLGNIGNADARNLLLKYLEEVLSARVIDPPRVRAATHVMVSLGKLSRSPRLTPAERADLVRRALKTLPKDQSRLAMQAAMQFFTYQPEGLPKDLREWAVAVLTAVLWLQEDTPEWAQGAERQESILGFRHGITEALKRLVPESPGPFLDRIERQSLRYGGAFMAVAEVCEKTRLEASLPTLEKMVKTALVFDDTDVSKYEAESYWDAAARQRVRLSKDKVVGPLVYAIGTIGGVEALRILSDLDDQIRDRRIANPGPDTTRFLASFLEKLKRAGPGEAAAAEEALGEGGAGAAGAMGAAAEEPFGPERLAEIVKTLRSSFVLAGAAKRRLKKISAISELGKHTPMEGIEPLIEQTADRDEMVAGAARTALLEYTHRRVPASVRARCLQAIGRALGAKDPAMRQAATQTLREIGTALPEVRALLEQELKAAGNATVEKHIQLLLKESTASKGKAAGAGVGAGAAAGGEPAAGGKEDAEAAAELARQTRLDAKRQYVLARQEWIRGGKKGPPPQPPGN